MGEMWKPAAPGPGQRQPSEGSLLLARDSFVHLHDPRGWRIDCISGCAWITQEGELHDTLLTAGQRHVAQGPARLLLQALDDCALDLHLDPARRPTRLVSHA